MLAFLNGLLYNGQQYYYIEEKIIQIFEKIQPPKVRREELIIDQHKQKDQTNLSNLIMELRSR